MGLTNWLLLSRFQRAVQKLRFLLNFNLQKWRIRTLMASPSRRQMSFKDPMGLLECTDQAELGDPEMGRSPIQRTSSDDIDNRAEIFIANFYKRLQMERQISLQLRYLDGNRLERTRSD